MPLHPMARLTSAAEALEANLEQQRVQQRQHELAMETLRRQEAELRQRVHLAPVAIGDLPAPALQCILLTAVRTDNLLRYVAACASVCATWRRVVAGSQRMVWGCRGVGLSPCQTIVLQNTTQKTTMSERGC